MLMSPRFSFKINRWCSYLFHSVNWISSEPGNQSSSGAADVTQECQQFQFQTGANDVKTLVTVSLCVMWYDHMKVASLESSLPTFLERFVFLLSWCHSFTTVFCPKPFWPVMSLIQRRLIIIFYRGEVHHWWKHRRSLWSYRAGPACCSHQTLPQQIEGCFLLTLSILSTSVTKAAWFVLYCCSSLHILLSPSVSPLCPHALLSGTQ